MKLFDLLEQVEWGMKFFSGLCTGREVLRRDIMRAVKKGLVLSIGDVPLADDDCYIIQPERYREAFVLTDKGKELLESKRKDIE